MLSEFREGTEPSLMPIIAEIMIGMVDESVSRNPNSNPNLSCAARCSFVACFHLFCLWRFCQESGYGRATSFTTWSVTDQPDVLALPRCSANPPANVCPP